MTSKPPSLVESLLSITEDNRGGAIAQQRFDFQAAWGILHLIDLHVAGVNYAIAFEFHDDILAIDDITAPTCMQVYQIKTRAGFEPWTIKELTNYTPPKTKRSKFKPSIIGKLYSIVPKFGNQVNHLGFVSNRNSDFLSHDNNPTLFHCKTQAKQAELKNALMGELGLLVDVNDIQVHYHISEIPLNDVDAYLEGKLAQFLVNSRGNFAFVPKAFAAEIFQICKHRSKQLADVHTFQSLLRSKFVTRNDMESILDDVQKTFSDRADWQEAVDFIPADQLRWRRNIRIEFKKYEILCMDPESSLVRKAQSLLQSELKKLDAAGIVMASDDLVQHLVMHLKDFLPELDAVYGEIFALAATIYECVRP